VRHAKTIRGILSIHWRARKGQRGQEGGAALRQKRYKQGQNRLIFLAVPLRLSTDGDKTEVANPK
jgi:hypothetical protein